MTINEFFGILESLDTKWVIDGDGCVTATADDCCPIWAAYRLGDVDYERDLDDGDPGAVDVFEAGRRMGLREKTVRSIVNSADNRAPFNGAFRRRLLELPMLRNPTQEGPPSLQE